MAVNILTTEKIKKLTEPGRTCDGRGLYLQVSKWGTRAWVFRFMQDGNAREMGLGPLNEKKNDGGVTLAEAREMRDRCHKLLREGIDPIEHRKQQRNERRRERDQRITFKEAAHEFLKIFESGWRNEKTPTAWRSSLNNYAFPRLGSLPVLEIDDAQINDVLLPLWKDQPETARRTGQRIRKIIKWVKDGKPFPTPSKAKTVKHHKAVAWKSMPEFMQRLRGMDSISARALEFTILTAARTGETIGATWDEIDFENNVWDVPADRTKTGKPHRVPLSDRAIEILKSVPHESGNHHVFIGARERKGLSNMAMLELLRGMEGHGFTVHGFRSSFKDWCSEATDTPNIISEMALAHAISDETEKAYRRGDLLAKRAHLMQRWSSYCQSDPNAEGKVVSMKGRAA